MSVLSLGILGAGHLASYCVAGLRNANDQRSIVLSPRNKRTASQIAQTHHCQIAESNQQVIDQSDIILLAVRPHQLDDLLIDLEFKPSQLIISAIAGITLDQFQSYPNLSNHTIVRTLPTVCAEVNAGPVPLFPDNKQAFELLNSLGTVITLDNEAQFDIATVHACMNGWLYFWLDEMVSWTKAQGIPPEQAYQLTQQTIQGALEMSILKQNTLQAFGHSIATPGTYTLAGLQSLESKHSLEDWSDTMQLVLNKLKQG